MQWNEIDDQLRETAFEFFYWFSRFESALKENNFLKNKTLGAKAEADWQAFVARYAQGFQASVEAKPT